MTYKCLIVDDEKLGRELIKSYIAHFPYLEASAEATSAIEAVQLLAKQDYDILFLDINMPQISGIDLLKQSKHLPLTILCTAYSEYALESYEFDVVDYLLKPIDLGRFTKAITKIMDRLNIKAPVITLPTAPPKPAFFFVKSEYKKVRIDIPKIQYIEAMEKYVRIHLETERVLTLMSMSGILELLPPDNFIRIHRSYIINTQKITMLEGNRVVIGEIKLPVSKANRKVVNEIIGS